MGWCLMRYSQRLSYVRESNINEEFNLSSLRNLLSIFFIINSIFVQF